MAHRKQSITTNTQKEIFIIEPVNLRIYKTKAAVTPEDKKVIQTETGERICKPMWSVNAQTVRRQVVNLCIKRISMHQKHIFNLQEIKRNVTMETSKIKAI